MAQVGGWVQGVATVLWLAALQGGLKLQPANGYGDCVSGQCSRKPIKSPWS
jgi:hypothetical protein